jgi:hypothetical protein
MSGLVKNAFFCSLWIFVIVPVFAFASDASPQIEASSRGWKIVQEVRGDLNGDGIADVAVILLKEKRDKKEKSEESGPDSDDDIYPKADLKIYLGGANGKYSQKLESRRAICLMCGGASGASVPVNLEINKGVLWIVVSGGAREKFGTTTKWRFRAGDFDLIGITEVTTDPMVMTEIGQVYSTSLDANVATLKMEFTRHLVKGFKEGDDQPTTHPSIQKCAVPAPFKDMRLSKFDMEAFQSPACK